MTTLVEISTCINLESPSQDKKPVKTGDATAAAGWMLAMIAAGAVVLVRKRNS